MSKIRRMLISFPEIIKLKKNSCKKIHENLIFEHVEHKATENSLKTVQTQGAQDVA